MGKPIALMGKPSHPLENSATHWKIGQKMALDSKYKTKSRNQETLTARIEKVRKTKWFKRTFDAKEYTVLLDRVVVNNDVLTFVFRDGRTFERTYRLPRQKPGKER